MQRISFKTLIRVQNENYFHHLQTNYKYTYMYIHVYAVSLQKKVVRIWQFIEFWKLFANSLPQTALLHFNPAPPQQMVFIYIPIWCIMVT